MIIYIYVTRNIFYVTKMPFARIWRCVKQKIAGAAIKRTLPSRVLQKEVFIFYLYQTNKFRRLLRLKLTKKRPSQ